MKKGDLVTEPKFLDQNKIIDYRRETFEDMGFTKKESQELAEAKDSKGVFVHWTAVRRALEAKQGHKLIVKIFT